MLQGWKTLLFLHKLSKEYKFKNPVIAKIVGYRTPRSVWEVLSKTKIYLKQEERIQTGILDRYEQMGKDIEEMTEKPLNFKQKKPDEETQ